ncbi:MAG: GNAT family N-acetyltransferase [Sandaracinaceae bacterium]
MSSVPIRISREHPSRAIHVSHRGADLVLRPIGIADTEILVDAIRSSLPELKPWMPWAHYPVTVESQLAVNRSFEAKYFAAQDMVMGLFDGGALLAMIGLHPRVPLNPRALEVGYWTPSAVAGRGFATLGARVATLYAFDRLGCDRVQVMHDEANAASRRVIEKCGFALEGRLRAFAAAPSDEAVAGGFRHSGVHLMWALFPDTFEALPWVDELRAATRYEDVLGRPA